RGGSARLTGGLTGQAAGSTLQPPAHTLDSLLYLSFTKARNDDAGIGCLDSHYLLTSAITRVTLATLDSVQNRTFMKEKGKFH
ncbi:MAG TPA: hypothetical protein VJP76_08550, partial [Candidatus Tumulicola sp.]|nr:hypothetical protein [Candidatus Tumulicola sp.]